MQTRIHLTEVKGWRSCRHHRPAPGGSGESRMEKEPLLFEVDQSRLGLSPTDVSQFIRLDQCERYLRLRLHERACGAGFMKEYGVQPQAIPPLLTRSGRSFEEEVESAIRAQCSVINLAEEAGDAGDRGPDNARVVAA